MAVTLLGLAVSLQAVTRRIEQFTHQSAAHLVALLLQRFGQSSHAFAGPPQRRFRIPPGRRFDQRLEIGDQCRILDDRRLAARPRPPTPPRDFVLRQFLQPPSDRARRHAGCHRHRGNATITRSKRLRRRDQTTAPFVEKRRYCRKPLLDGFNIDHHHNILYARVGRVCHWSSSFGSLDARRVMAAWDGSCSRSDEAIVKRRKLTYVVSTSLLRSSRSFAAPATGSILPPSSDNGSSTAR